MSQIDIFSKYKSVIFFFIGVSAKIGTDFDI